MRSIPRSCLGLLEAVDFAIYFSASIYHVYLQFQPSSLSAVSKVFVFDMFEI